MGERTIQETNMLIILALLLLVMMSAIALIYSTYSSRTLFAELETMKRSANEMNVRWGQYLLEQSTWSAHDRIVALAEQELGMRYPDPADVVMLERLQ